MKPFLALLLLLPYAAYSQTNAGQGNIPDRAAAVAIQEWYAEQREQKAWLERSRKCRPPVKGQISTKDCPDINSLSTRSLDTR